MTFSKIVRVGRLRGADAFAKIAFSDGRLSISGVVGPKANGGCTGSCGQWVLSFKEYDPRGHATLADIAPAPGWAPHVRRFFDTWARWHLNDMRAGSAAQEAYLRERPLAPEAYTYPKSYYDAACAHLRAAGLHPDADGYLYGSAWRREEVPAEVIAFLQSLPDADRAPAWV